MLVTKHARKKIRRRYGLGADATALAIRALKEGLHHSATSGKLAWHLYRLFNDRAQDRRLMEDVSVYAWDGHAWVFVQSKLVTVGTIPVEIGLQTGAAT